MPDDERGPDGEPGHEWYDRPDWVGVHDAPGREYFYVKGELLVDSDDTTLVEPVLSALGAEQVIDIGLGLDLWGGIQEDIPRLVAMLRGLRGNPPHRPVRAFPHHALTMTNHIRYSPGTEPRPADPLERPSREERAAALTVGAIDTGVREDHPWFGGSATGDPEDQAKDGTFAGHGTFVAGVVLQHAPDSSVIVYRPGGACEAGFAAEVDVARRILQLLDDHPDIEILNLSLGGYTHDNIGLPAVTKALQGALEPRAESKRDAGHGLVVVAAAGNDDTDRPFFPAAMSRVIGVGAIDRGGVRPTKDWTSTANYGNWGSNHGWWVDACALGVGVHSTFLEGDLPLPGLPPTERAAPQTFDGFARWDGTSFSAPAVAAAIADRAGRTNIRPAQAAFELLQPSAGSPPVQDLGIKVAVPTYV